MLTFGASCNNNAAAAAMAQHNNKETVGTNGLETVLMAMGNDALLWEEGTTTGRRET